MRRALQLAVVVVGALGVVMVSTMSGVGLPGLPSPLPAPPEPPPVAAVSYTPALGGTESSPAGPATVTVDNGRLDEVSLTAEGGTVLPGEFNAERTSWSTTEPLEYGGSYTWAGRATGTDGKSVPLAGTFGTVTPKKLMRATLNIGDGRTVGVAAPIRIQFNGHIADRAAVEKALEVATSVPVEGAWGWLPDEGGGSRVDYRTKEYWPANIQVSVHAKLFGVAYGDGVYGAQDISSTFAVGRSQIVKADVNSFRLVVVRDGKKIADYPASYGLGSDPERNTRSGIHVVSEKFTDKRMVSERYDYDLVEKWAVRISNNGEFIHANPASAAAQGSSNVTHGCVNLATDDAKAYYNIALFGDPVEVTGTPVDLSAQDGDIWDWTLSWSEWKGLSALD